MIEFYKADNTLLATVTGTTTGILPADISVDASFTITYATTKEMKMDSNYYSDFYAKYSIKNWKLETAGLVDTQFSILAFNYVDQCGDPTKSQIEPFSVLDMQTSVLRTITEFPSAVVTKPDI